MKHPLRIFLIICLSVFLVIQTVPAQENEEITVEWIYSDEGETVDEVPQFFWLKDNIAIMYDLRQPDTLRTFEKLDPKSGEITPIVDMAKAMDGLEAYLGKIDTLTVLPWPESFDTGGRHAVYLFDDDIFLLEIENSQIRRVTETAEEEKSTRFSPDGKKLAFVRSNDIYVYDIEMGVEKRITFDGSETILNGTLSWVYWEEIFGRHDLGYWWSGDSKALAYLHTDESKVSIMYYPHFKPATTEVITQRYPKAGETNPLVHVGIVEIADPQTLWVELGPTQYEYIARIDWLPDNQRLCVQTLNREQTKLDIFFADRFTGKAFPVMKDIDEAWVNIHDDLYFLKNGKQFIWASERDGYAHLYRFDMKGNLMNQITRGKWAIRSAGGEVFWLRRAVTAIDEKNGWIYFTALEKSSIERHLYRIRFNGSGMEQITKKDGYHSISFSPTGEYYFDTYSNISSLPSLSLHKKDGTVKQVLAEPRPELLEQYSMQYPQLLSIPANDGFSLPAELLFPKDFDPNKKYPLIIYVYGGPSAPTVFNAWRHSLLFDQILLRKGFLVARVDPRSSTAISKILENRLHLLMSGDRELADLTDAVKWFKSQPYIDPERVGIWGWSGGGSFTLNAMTHTKEFRAGISVAPVTDWHYYDTKWAEFAMKRPQDNPEGYEKTSFVKTAKDIHGRLLLVHGTYDDNVHPQNSWHFIDELINANIMFDMMFYPMRKHGIKDRPARIHLYNTMLEFWEENL